MQQGPCSPNAGSMSLGVKLGSMPSKPIITILVLRLTVQRGVIRISPYMTGAVMELTHFDTSPWDCVSPGASPSNAPYSKLSRQAFQ